MWYSECRICKLLLRLWQTFVIIDKKEYLKNRFKRDFLQYSLLQEDSLPAKEIAEKLYGVWKEYQSIINNNV